MRLTSVVLSGIGALVLTGTVLAAEPIRGHQQRVAVSAPTRLDWTFALATQSLDPPPDDWLTKDYDSTKQAYELFVPPQYDPQRAHPLILFISPGNAPQGQKNWQTICTKQGALFASPFNAGNNVSPRQRVRIVLDVLDDIRRQYHIDPDRTYLAGFSGGGRIACGIAFALPEYFGGVVPVCAGENLRSESWLRQRVQDRLSVALVTGETDFNRGEVERLRGPLLRDVGMSVKVWVVPQMGHSVPGDKELSEVFHWLEQGVERRRQLAKQYPASRIAANRAPTRADWAGALLAEAKLRLRSEATLYTGLMQLQGCMKRWPDLPAGTEAKNILLKYDAQADKPWEADDIAEQRRFLLATARAVDSYASGPLPPQYAKTRPDMARQALRMWEIVAQDQADTPLAEEARKRMAALRKLTEDNP